MKSVFVGLFLIDGYGLITGSGGVFYHNFHVRTKLGDKSTRVMRIFFIVHLYEAHPGDMRLAYSVIQDASWRYAPRIFCLLFQFF